MIPEGVRSIGAAAFCDNESLTSVVIPEGTTSIEFNAFEGCTNLTSITFPETIISISDLTFDSCKALASLIIPESVTMIGYEAFVDCDNLTSIVIKGDITSIEQAAFSRCKKLKNITISVASLKKCKDATVWKVVSETLPISSLVQALTKAPKNCKKKIEEKLIKSEDLSVIRYFAGQGRLEEYAAVRGLDADELLDLALSDFGLNKDGFIHWTFAGKIITAKLENDLTITLWDKDGNALKSIPKRGVDLEEYNSVKKAFTQLKKDISTTAKQLNNRLFADWLTARPQKSTIWQSAYPAM